jgi:Holliday junction resolvase RusA-like endonuclease
MQNYKVVDTNTMPDLDNNVKQTENSLNKIKIDDNNIDLSKIKNNNPNQL